MSQKPIFVGGLMKSGTTLLRKLLGQHPNLFGGFETHWLAPEILDNWRHVSSQRQRWLQEFYDVPSDKFARLAAEATSGPAFIDAILSYSTERAKKQRWVEKTPDNIVHVALIRQHWPDAQVIHCVRDYRDVFASWKRTRTETIDEFIAKVRAVMVSLDGIAATRSDWYMEVPYDDLVTSTEVTLRATLEFLGERWIDGLDQYQGDSSELDRIRDVTGKRSRTLESIAKPIFSSSIGQWRSVLDVTEIERIEQELGQYMELWNWAPSTTHRKF